MTLVNEKDNHAFALTGNVPDLKPGERLRLKGKKLKGKEGKLTFRIKSVDHNYGACKP